MNNRKKIVIVGATSSIAEHCARLWLKQQPADLILIGRDTQRMEPMATDLQVRSPGSDVRIVQSDFLDPAAINTTVANLGVSGGIDIALIAHGSLPDQTLCQQQPQACQQALQINGISPVLFAEAFAQQMSEADKGTIALISSVAGDRGRRSNYVYGAAKGLVTRYAQGLQHRFAGSRVKVVLIKPGPTDTPMTSHLKATGAKLAPVESVAQHIVDGIAAGKAVVYAPVKWSLIMMVIRHLPRFVFNKMDI